MLADVTKGDKKKEGKILFVSSLHLILGFDYIPWYE